MGDGTFSLDFFRALMAVLSLLLFAAKGTRLILLSSSIRASQMHSSRCPARNANPVDVVQEAVELLCIIHITNGNIGSIRCRRWRQYQCTNPANLQSSTLRGAAWRDGRCRPFSRSEGFTWSHNNMHYGLADCLFRAWYGIAFFRVNLHGHQSSWWEVSNSSSSSSCALSLFIFECDREVLSLISK